MAPFKTINKAASLAMPGDMVIVHAGVYREWVDPLNSGITEQSRITYMAASRWRRPPVLGHLLRPISQASSAPTGASAGSSKTVIFTIRHNVLHDCGQNGIVGHMGCIFSTIEDNHIYNIAVKHEFFGYEIAGIKLHAAIDVTIRHNNIHNSALGTWLDWQAQGAHVHNNLYYANDRDLMIEVTHGPYLVENNIFIGGSKADADDASCGTAGYDKHPHGWEAYQALLKAYGNGDHEKFQDTPQAVYIAGNAYLNGAPAYVHETELCTSDEDCAFRISEEANGTYLEIQIPASLLNLKTSIVSTDTLGSTRITEGLYEDKNGNPYVIDYDFLGRSREDTPVAGPFEGLKVGLNRIKVWGNRL